MFTAPETDEIVQPAWQPPETDEILRGNIPLDTPDQMTRALRAQGPSGMTPPSMATTDEGLREIVNNPGQLPAFVMGLATVPGRIAYGAAADVVSKVASALPTLTEFSMPAEDGTLATIPLEPGRHEEYGGNVLYGANNGPMQPVDVFLADVAKTNPALAVAGRVGQDTAAMAPLAAVGLLPATVQKFLAAGFTADMILHAPEQFQAYGEEINKPYEQQDPDTLARLRSGIIQTFAFAPLAGAHAVKGVPAEIGYALDLARGMTPDAPRATVRPSGRPTMPAEEGAPVPAWEAGDMIVRSAEPSAPRPSPLAPPKELPPSPETTPAPTEAAPPRVAEPIQAASAPGAGENITPAPAPFMVDPATGRPRQVQGISRVQVETTLNVHRETLDKGRFPNGKRVMPADRKRLTAEIKSYEAVLKELDAQAPNDARVLRPGETAEPAKPWEAKDEVVQPAESAAEAELKFTREDGLQEFRSRGQNVDEALADLWAESHNINTQILDLKGEHKPIPDALRDREKELDREIARRGAELNPPEHQPGDILEWRMFKSDAPRAVKITGTSYDTVNGRSYKFTVLDQPELNVAGGGGPENFTKPGERYLEGEVAQAERALAAARGHFNSLGKWAQQRTSTAKAEWQKAKAAAAVADSKATQLRAELAKQQTAAAEPARSRQPDAPAEKVLKAGNVETAADVRTAQEAKPLGSGSKFSPAEAKEQKKFLLDAIEQAVAEAPDERPKNAADADAAALETVKAWQQGDTRQTFEARRDAVLEPLFEKYNVPDKDPVRGTGIGDESRQQRLERAVVRAQTELAPKVTIEVPGDGVFHIVNSKKALADFKTRAAKFPTTAPRASTPSSPRLTPTPAAAVGKLDAANTLKALRAVVSTDQTRGLIVHVWSDGKQTVATDGRRLTLIKQGLGGTEKNPKIFDVKGKEITPGKDKDGKPEKFPHWQQVVPPEYKAALKDLDTQKLFTVLRQAQESTTDKANSIILWRNKDGSLGVTAHAPEEISYAHNYLPDARAIAAFNPEYLIDAVNSARSVGDAKVTLHWIDELAPAKIEGKNSMTVVMPMRIQGGPGFTTKPLKGPEGMQAPRSGSGRVASPPALGGGDLGAGPRPPGEKPPIVDDPRHSVFDAMPMEMPEAVQMVKQLTGVFPEIRENLGDAAGVFTFTQGPAGKGKVSLLAKIFDLLDANDKARIKQEAINYAEAANPGATPAQKSRLANERYQFLLREAYEKAKLENPKQAMKTMWHEIGHVVDWLPDRIIRGRGNLFARLASLKGYFKHVLPLDPKRVGPFQEKPTPAELTKLRKEAYDAAQAEIGPMREIVETIMVEEPIYREAGITAEMVKRLFGMDARETMPELYRWFAEQSPAVKKEIVRSAMKGLVDERLKNAPAAGREQIGTRKIEREVRRREGRPPTPQEVEAKFKQMFRAELERRNLAELATVKRELEGLIAWWRGTERMPDYFKTSWEMYADAFSVFANNPAALESRAPTYAKLIWNYLDRKPEVKALYDQIQGDIKNGAVMPKRIQTLHEMWGRADAQSLDLAKSAGKLTGKDVLDNVQYHVDRRFGPIYRAAQGTRFQGRIADAVGNFLYRMSEHERYLAALNEQVGKLLVKHNLDWTNDLGEYLFHRRIVHERFNLANPLGWTSKNSIERLAELRTTLGPERWAALEEAGKRYRAEYERFVVAELESAKMFNPELQAAIAERAHYATFAALKGMPDEGIAKILETRFGSSVTPHIYSQIGNLGEIKNPATATVLKGLSLISSAYRNTMKKEVVRMLGELHPEDIMPAKTRWSGKGIEPIIVDNNPAVGTVVYLDQGKVRAFYVRRVVADAVNSATGGDNLAYSLLLNATGWQKGLFTQLNYGFWPFNFVKDTLGWWFQMPGITAPYYWAKNLPKAIMAARQSVTHSKPNPWADAALRRKMLISKGDPRGVWAAAENEFEVKLASFGMDPAQWKGQGDAVHRLVKAWDYYKNLGQTFERVNKINGMLYLDEKFASMPEWKKREIVRERGGSPNFLERGAANPMIDLVALFYNPWKESLRSVTKAARENPWSFATKATTAVLMPTILQAAAVNGWLGPDRKEQYDSIPDFDLTNYLVVPLGWVDRDARKVMYLRLPLWEPARVAHGLLFQSLTPRGKGLGAHAGGQLPGLNPMWKIGLAWASYLQGNNPVDTTRGVAVMPDKVFAAGGPATLAEMAKYTWNEMGGSVVYRFKNLNLESAPESEGEKFLAAPGVNNALGRWLKVSDRGLADQQHSLAGETQQARAEVQLGVDEILRRLTGEGSWDNLLQSLKSGDQAAMQRAVQAAQLTDAEKMLMRDPYALQYFTRKFPELVLSKANPDARMWFNAQSNEERAKLLEKGLVQPKPVR